MKRKRFSEWICPTRFKFARRYFGGRSISILDVGCGNHSPSITRRWFPTCKYHGADIQEYNLDNADRSAIDGFFPVTKDGQGYDAIPNGFYDFVILNHVAEHLEQPASVIAQLCAKLKPDGGLIWLAFPSLRSLALPSAEGTLHFCDDETHVYVPDVREIANVLLANGVKVLKGGRSHDAPRAVIGLLLLPVEFLRKSLTGKMKARGLWYVLGFEDRVIGTKR